MGIEYRNRAARQKRQRRRAKAEEDRWASLAGPVEVRRLDDDTRAEAEDEGTEHPGAVETEDEASS